MVDYLTLAVIKPEFRPESLIFVAKDWAIAVQSESKNPWIENVARVKSIFYSFIVMLQRWRYI